MSTRPKTHKDVEFHVEARHRGSRVRETETFITRSFADASGYAVHLGGAGIADEVYIDVVIWSASGARWFGGEDAVIQYNEDPEASVFERIQVKVNLMGRVP